MYARLDQAETEAMHLVRPRDAIRGRSLILRIGAHLLGAGPHFQPEIGESLRVKGPVDNHTLASRAVLLPGIWENRMGQLLPLSVCLGNDNGLRISHFYTI